jgi:hypothetical protein
MGKAALQLRTFEYLKDIENNNKKLKSFRNRKKNKTYENAD